MGYTSWSADAYASTSRSYASKSTADIFTKTTVDKEMSSVDVKLRESRDSDIHPESLSVIVNLDVTGSMQDIPEKLVKGKLGEVLDTLISHNILHPQVLFCANGDHECDRYPFQVGQFESGNEELMKWLTSTVLEGGGGGNYGESYALAWLFASRFTSIDCFEKRGIKGFIFTIGDECCLKNYPADKLKKIFNLPQASDMTAEQMLAEAERMYHVYHIHISHGRGDYREEISTWKELLGQRLIIIEDKDVVAEIIASTVDVVNGHDLESIVKSFDSSTAGKVTTALSHVTKDLTKSGTDIITL